VKECTLYIIFKGSKAGEVAESGSRRYLIIDKQILDRSPPFFRPLLPVQQLGYTTKMGGGGLISFDFRKDCTIVTMLCQSSTVTDLVVRMTLVWLTIFWHIGDLSFTVKNV
jgi:hypothetical protein